MARYGQLHVAVLNAGIAERGDFAFSEDNQWQKVLDVNLQAVMVGTRLAVRCMTHCGCPGDIGTCFMRAITSLAKALQAACQQSAMSLMNGFVCRYNTGHRVCISLFPQFPVRQSTLQAKRVWCSSCDPSARPCISGTFV